MREERSRQLSWGCVTALPLTHILRRSRQQINIFIAVTGCVSESLIFPMAAVSGRGSLPQLSGNTRFAGESSQYVVSHKISGREESKLLKKLYGNNWYLGLRTAGYVSWRNTSLYINHEKHVWGTTAGNFPAPATCQMARQKIAAAPKIILDKWPTWH